jgi:hypothetical protein
MLTDYERQLGKARLKTSRARKQLAELRVRISGVDLRISS